MTAPYFPSQRNEPRKKRSNHGKGTGGEYKHSSCPKYLSFCWLPAGDEEVDNSASAYDCPYTGDDGDIVL